jgi:hypothetical protein
MGGSESPYSYNYSFSCVVEGDEVNCIYIVVDIVQISISSCNYNGTRIYVLSLK